jgi:hypothetical protein
MGALGSAPGQRVIQGEAPADGAASLETSPFAAATLTPSALDATTPWVRRWLRAEGVVAFVAGLMAWVGLGGNPVVLVALILVPDVSMLGYLRGPRVGAIAYNLVHSWATAGIVAGAGLLLGQGWLVLAGVLLLTHAGMDRGLGYGLKYPTAFQDTHLGRIGRSR